MARPVIDAEQQQRNAEAGQRHRVAAKRMRRRWLAAGYDHLAHLRNMAAEGDRGVLVHFIRLEGERKFTGSWLASHDLYEVVQEIWRREATERGSQMALRQAAGDRG